MVRVKVKFRVIEALASGWGKASPRKLMGKAYNGLDYRPDVSASTKNLVDHLIEVQECDGLEGLDVGYDLKTNLRGIYSKKTFQEGEFICGIPYTSTLLLDERFISTTKPLDEKKRAFSYIQIGVKLLEMFRKPATPLMSLYGASLPLSRGDSNFSPTPQFWTENEIMELEAPRAVHALLKSKNYIRDFVAEKQPDCTEAELTHAMCLVGSRCFTSGKDMSEGVRRRTSMVPFIDLVNHKRSSNAKSVLVPETTRGYECPLRALFAKKNIEKGEEITICYGSGNEPSWDVFCNYGFWPEGHDENDMKLVSEVVEPDIWTTSLENDLDELKKLSGDDSIKRSILNFRIRLKKAERARAGRTVGPL